MRSFWAIPANSHYPTRIHPALTSFADECCGTLARLIAYVGTLALLAIVGVHLWDQLPDGAAPSPPPKRAGAWPRASHPAFAVSQFDLPDKTETYEILRHPEGGRKDIFRWAGAGEKPVAELEIYRPGARIRPIGTRVGRTRGANGPRRRGASWKPPASSTANSAP